MPGILPSHVLRTMSCADQHHVLTRCLHFPQRAITQIWFRKQACEECSSSYTMIYKLCLGHPIPAPDLGKDLGPAPPNHLVSNKWILTFISNVFSHDLPSFCKCSMSPFWNWPKWVTCQDLLLLRAHCPLSLSWFLTFCDWMQACSD